MSNSGFIPIRKCTNRIDVCRQIVSKIAPSRIEGNIRANRRPSLESTNKNCKKEANIAARPVKKESSKQNAMCQRKTKRKRSTDTHRRSERARQIIHGKMAKAQQDPQIRRSDSRPFCRYIVTRGMTKSFGTLIRNLGGDENFTKIIAFAAWYFNTLHFNRGLTPVNDFVPQLTNISSLYNPLSNLRCNVSSNDIISRQVSAVKSPRPIESPSEFEQNSSSSQSSSLDPASSLIDSRNLNLSQTYPELLSTSRDQNMLQSPTRVKSDSRIVEMPTRSFSQISLVSESSSSKERSSCSFESEDSGMPLGEPTVKEGNETFFAQTFTSSCNVRNLVNRNTAMEEQQSSGELKTHLYEIPNSLSYIFTKESGIQKTLQNLSQLINAARQDKNESKFGETNIGLNSERNIKINGNQIIRSPVFKLQKFSCPEDGRMKLGGEYNMEYPMRKDSFRKQPKLFQFPERSMKKFLPRKNSISPQLCKDGRYDSVVDNCRQIISEECQQRRETSRLHHLSIKRRSSGRHQSNRQFTNRKTLNANNKILKSQQRRGMFTANPKNDSDLSDLKNANLSPSLAQRNLQFKKDSPHFDKCAWRDNKTKMALLYSIRKQNAKAVKSNVRNQLNNNQSNKKNDFYPDHQSHQLMNTEDSSENRNQAVRSNNEAHCPNENHNGITNCSQHNTFDFSKWQYPERKTFADLCSPFRNRAGNSTQKAMQSPGKINETDHCTMPNDFAGTSPTGQMSSNQDWVKIKPNSPVVGSLQQHTFFKTDDAKKISDFLKMYNMQNNGEESCIKSQEDSFRQFHMESPFTFSNPVDCRMNLRSCFKSVPVNVPFARIQDCTDTNKTASFTNFSLKSSLESILNVDGSPFSNGSSETHFNAVSSSVGESSFKSSQESSSSQQSLNYGSSDQPVTENTNRMPNPLKTEPQNSVREVPDSSLEKQHRISPESSFQSMPSQNFSKTPNIRMTSFRSTNSTSNDRRSAPIPHRETNGLSSRQFAKGELYWLSQKPKNIEDITEIDNSSSKSFHSSFRESALKRKNAYLKPINGSEDTFESNRRSNLPLLSAETSQRSQRSLNPNVDGNHSVESRLRPATNTTEIATDIAGIPFTHNKNSYASRYAGACSKRSQLEQLTINRVLARVGINVHAHEMSVEMWENPPKKLYSEAYEKFLTLCGYLN